MRSPRPVAPWVSPHPSAVRVRSPPWNFDKRRLGIGSIERCASAKHGTLRDQGLGEVQFGDPTVGTHRVRERRRRGLHQSGHPKVPTRSPSRTSVVTMTEDHPSSPTPRPSEDTALTKQRYEPSVPAIRNQSQKIQAFAICVIASGVSPSPPRTISGVTPLGMKYTTVQASITKKRMAPPAIQRRRAVKGQFTMSARMTKTAVGAVTRVQKRSMAWPARGFAEVGDNRLREGAAPLGNQRDA